MMANREWETPHIETFDERASARGQYKRFNRKTQALQERRFRVEDLTDQDLRSGDTRRFLLDDGYGDLRHVFTVKNTFEGLVD